MADDRYGPGIRDRHLRARRTSIFEQLGAEDERRRDPDRWRGEDRADDEGAHDRGHYGAEHGYGGFQGDYGGGRDQGGFGGQGDYRRGRLSFTAGGAASETGQDRHYRIWRDRQLAELDRDYAEYRRERQQQFDSDFQTWRSNRGRIDASAHGEEAQRQGRPGKPDAQAGSTARSDAGTSAVSRGRGRSRSRR